MISISLAKYMATIRRVTFLTTLVFSFVVLSLSAALISLTEPVFYYSYSALALATSVLTLLTIGSMFFIDWYCKGAYFSSIVVEVSCLSFLWILWLSSGASTAQKDQEISDVFPEESGCTWPPYSPNSFLPSYGYLPYDLNLACHETKAIMAFSFLTWILLMFYTVTLLVLALRAQWRGHNVWQTAVCDGTLLYTSEKVVGGAPEGMPPQPAVYHPYPQLMMQQSAPLPAQQYVLQPAQQSLHPLAPQSPPPPAQPYVLQPAREYIPPPAQQPPPSLAQQYVLQPAPQREYTPPSAHQSPPPLAQQPLPTSVSHAYPTQV